MGKTILILTILIVSDMLFHWGLPLGGIVFLVWLFLFGLYGEICKKELQEKGDKNPVDWFCVVFLWILFLGICLLGNPIMGTVVGSCIVVVSIAIIIGRSEEWKIEDKSLVRKKLYVNLTYALFVPIVAN